MNCRGVSRRLSAYIDNNLSPGIMQGVEDHLQHCAGCKRKLAEFEAIITAAHNLAPLAISNRFEEKVLEAVHSRLGTHEILSDLRYRLTLAGVAFMVTSAAIFFVVGPPSTNLGSIAATSDSLGVNSAQAPDFYAHPETKVKSFPIPPSSDQDKFAGDEKLGPVDSIGTQEYIMPNVQKVNENISGKF
jgi:anti-sigma factor RsiW